MKRFLGAIALLPILATGCRHKHDGGGVAPQPPPWLDAKVEEQANAGAPGSERISDLYRGVAFEEDGRTDWNMPLEDSKCYWFSIVGDPGVRQISLYLWDPDEHRVADRKSESPMTMLSYCPRVGGMFHLQAKVREGAGHYAVGIYAKGAPKRAPEPTAPAEATLEERIKQQAASAAPGAAQAGEFLSGSDKTDWYAALEAGTCYWFIGAGDAKVKRLWLYLWDPNAKRITETKSDTANVMVGHCATTGGMFHIQGKIDSGSGNYKVGIYAKPSK